MAVKLVFLGRLADVVGAGERLAAAGPAAAILAALPADVAGPRVRYALNGEVVADLAGLTLSDGDELAFLPPVSGG